MMNWNREVSKNLEHTKIGITDVRDTAERRRVLKAARRWARWQRDQLRTNEAVERLAKAHHEILLADLAAANVDGPKWEDLGERDRKRNLEEARAGIDALLGVN